MAYIGNPILSSAFPLDTFTGDGTTVAFTMTFAPASTNSMVVCVDGVKQAITTYGINGYTLTFSEAPPSSANIEILYLGIPASGVTNTAYRTVTEFTATASQTNFTVPSYSVGFVTVFQNGIKLGSADFTATDGVTVVLGTGATAGDLVAVESFYVSSMNGAISQNGGAFSGNVQFPKGTAAAPSIFFNEGTTSGFYSNVNTVGITTNGTSAVYIDDIQEVGIGTVTPTNKLTVVDNSANAAVRITQTGAGAALVVEDSANPDSTPFVVDASGTVVIGHTSSITNGSVATTPVLQQHGLTNNASSIGLSNWSSTAARTPSLNFNRSISDTVGTRTSLSASGTALGMISFTGDDGTNWIESARIASFIDGTPGTNDMPGRLVFYTTADGGSSLSERMRISAAGDVGIGASPSARLTVDSGSTGLLATFNSTATNGGYISGYSSGTAIWDFGTAKQAFNTGTSSDVGINTRSGFLGFGTNTTERMRIDTSGRLLIGTSSVPVTTVVTTGLVVYSQSLLGTSATGTNVNKDFRLLSGAYSGNAATILTIDGTSGNNILYYGGGTGAGEPATYHTWYTGTAGTLGVGTERMRLDNSGNLGLGVTPSAWSSYKALQVNEASLAATTGSNTVLSSNAYFDGTNWRYIYSNYASRYLQLSGAHSWHTAASGTSGNTISYTQAMTLNASGNLSVGTTVGNAKFTVQNDTAVQLFNSAGSNQSDLDFPSVDVFRIRSYYGLGSSITFATNPSGGGNTERMRIDSSGNVLFGTTGVPNGTSVYGSAFVPISYGRSRLAMATSDTGDLQLVQFFNPNGQVGAINTNNSETNYYTTPLSTTGAVLVRNGVQFPASQVASSNANTLDDYEEGTWTPSDGSGAGLSLGINSARYTKVGNLVFVQFYVDYPSSASGAGVRITGLPFITQSGSYYSQGAARSQLLSAPLVAQAITGSIDIDIYKGSTQAVINEIDGGYLVISLVYQTN